MELNNMILTLPDTLMIVLDELDALEMTVMENAFLLARVDPSTFEGAGQWVEQGQAVTLTAALIRKALGNRSPTGTEEVALIAWFSDAIIPAE